jgi:hypothetical protein
MVAIVSGREGGAGLQACGGDEDKRLQPLRCCISIAADHQKLGLLCDRKTHALKGEILSPQRLKPVSLTALPQA